MTCVLSFLGGYRWLRWLHRRQLPADRWLHRWLQGGYKARTRPDRLPPPPRSRPAPLTFPRPECAPINAPPPRGKGPAPTASGPLVALAHTHGPITAAPRDRRAADHGPIMPFILPRCRRAGRCARAGRGSGVLASARPSTSPTTASCRKIKSTPSAAAAPAFPCLPLGSDEEHPRIPPCSDEEHPRIPPRTGGAHPGAGPLHPCTTPRLPAAPTH